MNFWRAVLVLAALYNLVIGGSSMAAAEPGSQMQITGLLVACFGIVYAICAADIARFRPVLWTGVIGKAGVIAMLAPQVASGALPPVTGWILTGDALFTLLFLLILLWGKGDGRA